jgi:hypothetical protein
MSSVRWPENSASRLGSTYFLSPQISRFRHSVSRPAENNSSPLAILHAFVYGFDGLKRQLDAHRAGFLAVLLLRVPDQFGHGGLSEGNAVLGGLSRRVDGRLNHIEMHESRHVQNSVILTFLVGTWSPLGPSMVPEASELR